MNKQKAILIVEDEPDDLELIVRALGDDNPILHLITCHNGMEALEYLNSLRERPNGRSYPTLVLLDLSMPKVGGMDFLRDIRSQTQFRLLPVVIFSSSKNKDDILKCYEAGANGYVNKPSDYDGFKDALRAISKYWITINKLVQEY
ncbi:MAG: response regulator [Dehalococcoidia bacterium]|nr:MAG: response regulator [Dehalococcoidia bacterium]